MTEALDLKVVETHTAVLFFLGEHVYKLKKALDLGFLDHTDREARLAACRNEVDLNRRLAPDVYLGVVDLLGEDGLLIDHLVDMRRMPDDRRLSRLIEEGSDVDAAVRQVAHAIAGLHGRGTSDPDHDRRALVGAVRDRWRAGFDQVRTLAVDQAVADAMDDTEELALRYLAGRGPLFEDRIAGGWVRDGHGDLLADDIFVLDDGPRILDCLEFGDEYRWGDVLSDVAFLAMDLERLGRADLARTFLELHRELTADRWPASLAHHYIAYRAHIRAKVGVVRAAQGDEGYGASVPRSLELALDHLRAAQVQVILVGGAPGTGKSTLAASLGDQLGAVVLRTDEVRHQAPIEGGDPYAPEAVAATYREVLLEARRLVELGEHVILDATWRSEAHRELARRLAVDASCVLTELRCTLPRAEADERIRRRRAARNDPSEVTPEIAADLAAQFETWPQATEIDNRGAPSVVAREAWSLLGPNGSPRWAIGNVAESVVRHAVVPVAVVSGGEAST